MIALALSEKSPYQGRAASPRRPPIYGFERCEDGWFLDLGPLGSTSSRFACDFTFGVFEGVSELV